MATRERELFESFLNDISIDLKYCEELEERYPDHFQDIYTLPKEIKGIFDQKDENFHEKANDSEEINKIIDQYKGQKHHCEIHDLVKYYIVNFLSPKNGVYKAFKFRQPEHGLPPIILKRDHIKDHPKNNIDSLFETSEKINVYRGLSIDEHQKREYGQSWTTDLNEAKKFSGREYQNGRGIVVKTEIGRNQVIFFNDEDAEKEVIVEFNSIKSAYKVKQ